MGSNSQELITLAISGSNGRKASIQRITLLQAQTGCCSPHIPDMHIEPRRTTALVLHSNGVILAEVVWMPRSASDDVGSAKPSPKEPDR